MRVREVLGAAEQPTLTAPIEDAWEFNTAQLWTTGEWTGVFENNGIHGTSREVLMTMSMSATAMSLYRSVNADMAFTFYAGGERRRLFDPLLWPDEQYGEALAEEQGLVFGEESENPLGEALVLMERLTGLSLDRDWWLAARPVHSLSRPW